MEQENSPGIFTTTHDDATLPSKNETTHMLNFRLVFDADSLINRSAVKSVLAKLRTPCLESLELHHGTTLAQVKVSRQIGDTGLRTSLVMFCSFPKENIEQVCCYLDHIRTSLILQGFGDSLSIERFPGVNGWLRDQRPHKEIIEAGETENYDNRTVVTQIYSNTDADTAFKTFGVTTAFYTGENMGDGSRKSLVQRLVYVVENLPVSETEPKVYVEEEKEFVIMELMLQEQHGVNFYTALSYARAIKRAFEELFGHLYKDEDKDHPVLSWMACGTYCSPEVVDEDSNTSFYLFPTDAP